MMYLIVEVRLVEDKFNYSKGEYQSCCLQRQWQNSGDFVQQVHRISSTVRVPTCQLDVLLSSDGGGPLRVRLGLVCGTVRSGS